MQDSLAGLSHFPRYRFLLQNKVCACRTLALLGRPMRYQAFLPHHEVRIPTERFLLHKNRAASLCSPMPFVLIFGCFLFVLRLCRRFLIIIVLEEILIKIILEVVLEILKIIRRKEAVDTVYSLQLQPLQYR